MNILIVEDEQIIAKHLQFLLKGFGYESIDVATDYESAIELLEKNIYHLAIVDIQLSGFKTGIDIGQYIKDNLQIPFIFLTSHDEIAIVNAALETSPYAFLNKPFQKIAVYTAVNLAIKWFSKAHSNEEDHHNSAAAVIKDALFIKEKQMFIKILLSEILFIRSDDNYLELHTATKKYTIRETMKNMISQLPGDTFVRVHKSFIINLNHIAAIDKAHVVINDIEIPITSENRADLLSQIKIFT